jgi:protein-serine/threonine kinase
MEVAILVRPTNHTKAAPLAAVPVTVDPQAAADYPPGTRIAGFTIEQKIGEGGMAWLYRAVDGTGQRRVLKIPRGSFAADPACLVAFENELRLAPYLDDFAHAHMPVPQQSDRGHYLVMDYIEGVDLWTHLRNQGCFTEREAVAIGKKIARALGELHRRRIVHLDIKLSNIMLTPLGEARLIDFGLANHLDLPDHIYESFQEPKGTPSYIAPEQFYGVRDEPRSDLFSVGAMLFEMTTGRLPYPDAQTALDVVQRIRRTPVSPRTYRPELSAAFEKIVMTCLENVPDRRYANMAELLAALERLEGGETIEPASDAHETHADQGSTPAPRKGLFARMVPRTFLAGGDRLDKLKSWVEQHKRSRGEPPYRIVAAIDISADEREEVLNRAILAEAARFAQLQRSMITVLTVLPRPDVGMASGDKEMQMHNATCQEARARVLALVQGLGTTLVPVGINVRIGDTLDSIAGCLEDYGADLLIIGARDRNALSRFILGSTAYKVLTTIKCPVYVVQERTAVHASRRIATNSREHKYPGVPVAVASQVVR